jgi:hypothetical protein
MATYVFRQRRPAVRGKGTTLPLDAPPPSTRSPDSRFCLSGTFAFSARKECEAAVDAKGSLCSSLTQKTGYLVICIYATDMRSNPTTPTSTTHSLI